MIFVKYFCIKELFVQIKSIYIIKIYKLYDVQKKTLGSNNIFIICDAYIKIIFYIYIKFIFIICEADIKTNIGINK